MQQVDLKILQGSAASDPVMWRDILLSNKKSILDMLAIFKKDLAKLEKL